MSRLRMLRGSPASFFVLGAALAVAFGPGAAPAAAQDEPGIRLFGELNLNFRDSRFV